jgi:hypothetical protein
MADEVYERGLAIGDEMLGPEHGRAKVESADEFTRDFEEFCCAIPAALDGIRHAAAVRDELGVR